MLKAEYNSEFVRNQHIDEMSDEDLDFLLARFLSGVRKDVGQEYPGKTIYEMICSLFLIDNKGCEFRNLNSALNFVLKQRAGEVKQKPLLWSVAQRGVPSSAPQQNQNRGKTDKIA